MQKQQGHKFAECGRESITHEPIPYLRLQPLQGFRRHGIIEDRGCIMSPWLLSIYMDGVIGDTMLESGKDGVNDGRLYS